MTPEGYKRIGLILTTIVVATITWWAAHAWLTGPSPFSNIMAMIRPAIMLAILTAVVGLAFTLLSSRWDRLAIILASWATFVIFWPPDIWYLSILPLFVLTWYEASRRAQDDLSDRLKVRINATLGRSIKLVLLGIFLMVSLGFYLLPANRTSGIEVVSRGVQGALESAYEAPPVERQLAELPSALQAQFRRDVADSVDSFIREWFGPLGPLIPPILAFALFLALWSLSFLFREVAIWLGRGIFALMRVTRFVRIEEQDVRAEVLSL